LKQRIRGNQAGFTLIEITIGMAISAILVGGIITAIFQMGRASDMGNARVTAVKQVENALYYINRDVQMAQSIEGEGDDYSLRLDWNEWEQVKNNEVTYSLANGVLTRSYYINDELDSEKPVASGISALAITPPDTEAIPPKKVWTVDITATSVSGHIQQSETRQMKIIPRPGS
jgi:prepilin-type N-terminal cleavage/methylation domain-containing protein